MSGEEIDFRPVPLLEDLATLTPEDVAAAQSVRQTGPFNAFGLPPGAGGASYVVSSLPLPLLSRIMGYVLCHYLCSYV